MDSIIKIINAWDPADLLPMAPSDEYMLEINEIVGFLEDNAADIETLARKIDDIFLSDFNDESIYKSRISECRAVANQILKEWQGNCVIETRDV